MNKSNNSRRNTTRALILMLPLFMATFAGNCRGKRPERNENAIAIDNLINAKVRENLTASPVVRAVDIGIRTFNLKVTLEGTVRSEAERDEAVRITSETEVEKDGVKHKVREVDASQLRVSPG